MHNKLENSKQEKVPSDCLTEQRPFKAVDSYFPQCDPRKLNERLSGARNATTSVDDQLYDWGEEFWLSSQDLYPFSKEWSFVRIN